MNELDLTDLKAIAAAQRARLWPLPPDFYAETATLLLNLSVDGTTVEFDAASRIIRTIVTNRVQYIAATASTLDKQPPSDSLLDPEWILFERLREVVRKWGEEWLRGHPKFEPVIFM
jgi:hypothetical protein